MPEPIQSVARNACEYDPSHDVCSAPPASNPNDLDPVQPTPSPPGVAQLVSRNPPPGATAQCLEEGAKLLAASGMLLRSAGAMVVSAPTLLAEIPAIAAFIGSAIAVGATAAEYANCKDNVEAQRNTR